MTKLNILAKRTAMPFLALVWTVICITPTAPPPPLS